MDLHVDAVDDPLEVDGALDRRFILGRTLRGVRERTRDGLETELDRKRITEVSALVVAVARLVRSPRA